MFFSLFLIKCVVYLKVEEEVGSAKSELTSEFENLMDMLKDKSEKDFNLKLEEEKNRHQEGL